MGGHVTRMEVTGNAYNILVIKEHEKGCLTHTGQTINMYRILVGKHER